MTSHRNGAMPAINGSSTPPMQSMSPAGDTPVALAARLAGELAGLLAQAGQDFHTLTVACSHGSVDVEVKATARPLAAPGSCRSGHSLPGPAASRKSPW